MNISAPISLLPEVTEFLGSESLKPYREKAVQQASDYPEAARSLSGEEARAISIGPTDDIVSVIIYVFLKNLRFENVNSCKKRT